MEVLNPYIPTADQARALIQAAEVMTLAFAPFRTKETKANRKLDRQNAMGLTPGSALEELWTAITEQHNNYLLNGTRSVGFTKEILHEAELAQELKNGGWIVESNLGAATMTVTLPAS